MKDRLLSVKVVADRLDIDVQTVRRLIADGDLPAHRIGRLLKVSQVDLLEFVSQHRVLPTPGQLSMGEAADD